MTLFCPAWPLGRCFAFVVPRIAVAVDRNRKLAVTVTVAVAVGSLTAKKILQKFLEKEMGPLYFFLDFKVGAVDRKTQA